MSKPTYLTGTSTLTASGLRSRATTSTEAGLRAVRLRSSQDSVSPESMMSSTMSTCWPAMSRSRSLRMRTTPELAVAPAYELTAMNSIVEGRSSARARSDMNIAAPLSTPTSNGSRPA